MRLKPIQNSFNAGEFSPRMYGRTDVQKYSSGASTIENFHVMPEGGLERRSGFRYVSEAATGAVRVKEFVFSDEQAYVLEFGDRSVRFYRNEGLVVQQALTSIRASDEVSSESDEFSVIGHGYNDGEGPVEITTDDTLPTGLSLATPYYIRFPAVIPIAADALEIDTTVNEFIVAGTHGYSDLQGPFTFATTGALPTGIDFDVEYYIVWVSTTRFGISLSAGGAKVDITSVGAGTHTISPTDAYKRDKFRLSLTPSGAAVDFTDPGVGLHTLTPTVPIPITLTTPYPAADVPALHFAQSADVLYIAHPSHPPQKMSRYSAQGFFLERINFLDGPYLDENTTEDTMGLSATSGNSVTLTASTAIFKGSDVGRLVRIYGTNSTPHNGYGEIVAVDATTFTDTDIEAHDFTPADVTIGASGYITIAAGHGMDTGELVRFLEIGTLPSAFSELTDYFVRADTTLRIGFFPTKADAIANTNRIDPIDVGAGAPDAGRITSSVIDILAHGYAGGEGPVQLTSDGGLPAGLSAGTDYYISYVSANDFALSLTRGGAIVGIDDNQGGGTHSIQGASAPSAVCTINVKSDFNETAATTAWRLGAWSADPAIGFPRTLSFHEQRLWLAANPGAPQTLYASKASAFETMSPTGNLSSDAEDLDLSVNDDNAIVATIGSNEINVIRWISPSRTLIAGTASRVWNIQPASDSTGFAPGNIQAQPGGTRGTNAVQPVIVDNRPIFASQTALRVFSAGYDIDSDSYVGEDLTLVAEHVVRPGAIDFAFQSDPWSTVFTVRSDGQLAALTLMRDQDIGGWSRHVMGGSYVASYDRSFANSDVDIVTSTITDTAHGFMTGERTRFTLGAGGTLPSPLEADKDYYVRAIDDDTLALYETKTDAEGDVSRIALTTVGVGTHTFGMSTDAQVLSVASIPAPIGDPSSTGRTNVAHDQIGVMVRRTIGGVTKTTVEFLEDVFEPTDQPKNAFMVDSGLTKNGAASVTVTGLTHLAGELVDVLADGQVEQDLRVSSIGEITLTSAAALVHVGLPYRSSFASLRQAVASQQGTGEATLGRIDHLVLRLDSSLGGEFGHDLDHLTSLSDLLLPHDHLFDTIPPLFSDEIEVALDAPWDTAGRFAVRQSQPLPFTLLAVSTPLQKGNRGNRAR
jgi:hypothetical protein